MKPIKIFTFCIALIAITYAARATVRTVSNNANSPGQYTSLQAAHDAAANGDTLYIHASPVVYGSLWIMKRLTLIGEGAMPNRQVQYGTEVGTIELTYAAFPATTTASGSKIYGLRIGTFNFSSANASNSALVGGVTISRCLITGMHIPYSLQLPSSGNVLTQNIIGSTTVGLINSSVFNNIISSLRINSLGLTFGNNIISNNIIQGDIQTKGDLITNNIFYTNGYIGAANSTATTYTKNLFYAVTTPATISNIIYGSNTGTGNLFQLDPLFVTPALGSSIRAYTYTSPAGGPFADLHLQATSPGKNYGTDSTDIGIYGGPYPWVDADSTDSRFRYFAMPAQVPHMISMDVLNPALPQSGTLNVNFNARTQP